MLVNRKDIFEIRDLLVGYLVFLKKETFIALPGEELAEIEGKLRKTRHYIKELEGILKYEKNSVSCRK